MNARNGTTEGAAPLATVIDIGVPSAKWAWVRHLETGNVVADHRIEGRDEAAALLAAYQEMWPSHPLYVEIRSEAAPDDAGAEFSAAVSIGQGGATR